MADAANPLRPCVSDDARDKEIARLRKIVDALVRRADRGAEAEGCDDKLSETAITLEGEVRRRTEELVTALRENERIARALQYRDAILRAVTRSAAWLFSGAAHAESVPFILRTVGETISADRIVVLEANGAAPHVVLRHVWHRRLDVARVTPEHVAAWAMRDDPALAAWQTRLRAGEAVATRQRDATGAAKDLFAALGIRSNLQLPIFVDGAFWGQIGIDDCGAERAWVAAEIDPLRVLADLIGASIARERHTERLAVADALVRSGPAIFYRLRADSRPPRMVYVSDNVSILGRSAGEFLAEPELYLSLVHPHDRAAAARTIDDVIGGAGSGTVEFRVATADGTWRWFENRYTPLRRKDAPVEIEGVLVDVTDRRRAEETLRETLEREVPEGSPAGAEIGLTHVNGDVRQFHVVGRPIQLETGHGIAGAGVDVTEKLRAERLLRESEERFKGLVENTVDWVWEMDPEFRYTYASPHCLELFGYTPEELVGRSAFDFMTPADVERTKRETADLFAERRPMLNFETTFVHRSGRTVVTETNATPFFDADGRYRGYRGIDRDVTERNRITRALRESEEKFRTVFGSVTEGIFLIDPAGGTFVEVNTSGCALFGYTREELLGRTIEFVSSGEPPYTQAGALQKIETVGRGGPQSFEWHCRDKSGRRFWVAASARVTSFGGDTLVLATVRDITEQKRTAAQIMQMARYDALTGLANRRVFAEAVQQAIARAQRGAKGFAVLYLDLDHFKDINDTLGHPIGDLLLKSLAGRLKACVRETDTVARFGGDEFAVLAVDINDPTDAGVLGEKILAAVSKPVTIEGNEIRSGTSVGISVHGPDWPEAELLLAHADVALYRAKSEGGGTYRFFTDSMDAEVRKRVKLDADLRAAIDADQLFLVYQPQVEAASGRIVGIEALVRWRHPERGVVCPAEFIAAAEKNGLIVPLGRWVLKTACRQARAWREAGAAAVTMGVNLSALQFKTPLELEKDIAAALAESGLPPQLLELELTESVLMKASREHSDVLLRLRKRGLRLAIDDFGTGFSSLDYLRRFPVDRIKIAQVFIIDLVTAAGDAAIVKAAIGLARELGISVIAEGVETEAQLRLLQAWGCREVQGYYFSKPLEAEAMLPVLLAARIAAPGRPRIESLA